MQCDLLISNFQTQETIGAVKENIRHISNGSSSHRAGALQLGFEKAFELKKKKPQSPSTRLRCPRVGCPSYNSHVSYSSVPSSGGDAHYCPTCCNTGCYYFLQCASCGHRRKGNYTSCQQCGKRFL